MALLECRFKSEVLEMEQPFNVILPQISMSDTENGNKKFPVLYLLHGLSDDHTAWVRKSNIERYAAQYGLAVVMPNVNRSFYTDMKYGLKYYTYMTKEIPHIVRSYFPISDKREDNYIAGLSMGGYGAFMIALRNPEMFSAAASLSGALDLTVLLDRGDEQIAQMTEMLFGSSDEFINSDYNLVRLLSKADRDKLPRLYQCCGTEDFLYQLNENFRAAAIRYGVDLTYEEGPGDHEWGYWDTNIQRVLRWIFQK
ncbi:MAG TPA: esterase family protein [Clostridiaceae bacterium]|nr:esterase family protein [Clostridiaceae bacterium]